jgi:hypothetical protein
MQGENDAGCKWYQLLSGPLVNVGMHQRVANHAVFSCRTKSSELLPACATYYCICLAYDRAQFLTMKTHLEKISELTLHRLTHFAS